MKKILLLLIVIISCGVIASAKSPASEPLIAYKIKGLWYFLNQQGNELFPAKAIEDVLGYADGYFTIKYKDGEVIKNGMMNLKGEIVFKPDCDKLSVFQDSMAITIKYVDSEKTLGKYGFINLKGEQVISNKMNGVSFFSEGIAFAADGPKKGYIDKTGKFVITLDNMAGNLFSEGLAVVNNDKFKSGCIDKTGKVVIPLKYDELGDFTEGLNRFYLNAKVGFIDKSGNEVIRPIYDDAKGFSNGIALVAMSNSRGNYSWGFINKKGDLVSKDYKFELIRDFSENVAAVKQDMFWTFVDKEGNNVFPAVYSYAESFKNGIAWVSNKIIDRRGYMDMNSNFIIDIPKFEKAIDLRFNRKISL